MPRKRFGHKHGKPLHDPLAGYVHATCDSGKRSFESKTAAKQWARRLQTAGVEITRAYKCESCPHYHLTSKKERY